MLRRHHVMGPGVVVSKWVVPLAVAAIAALGLYVSVFGSFGPLGACMRTVPTASAAPSPTCGGDLRECLRLSAKTGIYGARYVTAEDVARCVEAFEACIHGTLGGGNPNPPPTSSPTRGGNGATMPRRFTIEGEGFDCTVSGSAVECIAAPSSNDPNTSKTIKATLSGLTMTGTRADHFVGPSVQGCVSTVDYSWPITVEFKSDGTGQLHMAQGHYDQTLSGSCSGSFTEPVDGAEGPLNWSPNE